MQQIQNALSQLSQYGKRLSTIDSSAKLYESIFDFLDSAYRCDEAAVYLKDTSAPELIFAAGRGRIIPTGPFRIGQDLKGRTIQTGEVHLAVNAPDRQTGDGITTSEVAVPLCLGNETIGVIEAVARGALFRESDRPILEVFASLLQQAVSVIHLRETMNQRTRKLSKVVQAGQSRLTDTALSTHLERILNCVMEALQPEGCAIRLLDEETRLLVTAAALGRAQRTSDIPVPRDQGVMGTALATQRPSIIPSPPKDTPVDFSSTGEDRYLSEIAVPLMFRDSVLGVLHLFHRKSAAFDDTDLIFAGAFADLSAQTVGISRLDTRLSTADVSLDSTRREMSRLNNELGEYAKRIVRINNTLESQLKNLTTIHEAGKAITSSLDLDATLSTILDMTSQIIGSTAGAIKLLDDETKEFRTRAQSGSLTDISSSCTILEVPLQIGNKKIGIFELICKTQDGVGSDERRMVETLASQAAIAIENARLFKDTQQIYYDTLKSLAQALEARDDYTRGHSERVARIARLIAVQMELPEDDIETIENAALLHDIGKIGIRDDVLLAPRKLTDSELSAIKEHSVFGNTILMPLKFLGRIRECVRHHHERWNGTGYPDGLKGADIPTASRIIAVADAFDAMTSNRPYRESISHDAAAREIASQSGIQFDPDVVEAFLRLLASTGSAGLMLQP